MNNYVFLSTKVQPKQQLWNFVWKYFLLLSSPFLLLQLWVRPFTDIGRTFRSFPRKKCSLQHTSAHSGSSLQGKRKWWNASNRDLVGPFHSPLLWLPFWMSQMFRFSPDDMKPVVDYDHRSRMVRIKGWPSVLTRRLVFPWEWQLRSWWQVTIATR